MTNSERLRALRERHFLEQEKRLQELAAQAREVKKGPTGRKAQRPPKQRSR